MSEYKCSNIQKDDFRKMKIVLLQFNKPSNTRLCFKAKGNLDLFFGFIILMNPIGTIHINTHLVILPL